MYVFNIAKNPQNIFKIYVYKLCENTHLQAHKNHKVRFILEHAIDMVQ